MSDATPREVVVEGDAGESCPMSGVLADCPDDEDICLHPDHVENSLYCDGVNASNHCPLRLAPTLIRLEGAPYSTINSKPEEQG